MEVSDFFNRANSEYIEQLFQQYQADPASVDPLWAAFFAGFQAGGTPGAAPVSPVERGLEGVAAANRINHLVHAYREVGHLAATIDPLGKRPLHTPLLELSEFGFPTPADLSQPVGSGQFMGPTDGTLGGLVDALKTTYCRTFGVEYMDIPDKAQRAWLQEKMEPSLNLPKFTDEETRRILRLLVATQKFEEFLHTKYIGQKRFSVEGGEAAIPLLDTIIETGADLGVEHVVLGMAHRGRLNVLAQIFNKPVEMLFTEFEGTSLPEDAEGDVKYHLGFSNDRVTVGGKKVHCTLSHNPSHLEIVNPVIEGMVYAKQQALGDTDQTKVIPILVHGEAAFAGQGVVYETLNLSQLRHYTTGGTIHIIINNQVGFTANAWETRYTPYPTDVANAIKAPVIHVNGDDPDAVVHAAKLAVEFRQKFKRDVMIDLWCFRKFGHNETDDPTFTQPGMYHAIASHKPVAELYAAKLVEENRVPAGTLEEMVQEVHAKYEAALSLARETRPRQKIKSFGGSWEGLGSAGNDWGARTAVEKSVIDAITAGGSNVPSDFNVHPKLKKLLASREEMGRDERPIDWGCGEMWAFGSLLLEGTPVRLTGQDSERGTFSHRHSVLHDVENDHLYAPLAHLSETQAKFTVVNTMLSELAVLGFEFGFSRAEPRALVLWEAQFGDFVNGAQMVIDQFISASESKWQRMSGIVMLLPHGYEGQGPEHSSARLERFLQLCAENNLQVAYPTSPAQYFHLLRRQMKRPFRKPLILMMPKSLLRHPGSTSKLADFTEGAFMPVIEDLGCADRTKVQRVLVCSGKVYFTLLAARDEHRIEDVAIMRVEQLYPMPERDLSERIAMYPNTREVLWVQEEPKNMGAWSYMLPRLHALLGVIPLKYCGRSEAASPAVGSYKLHNEQEKRFVSEAMGIAVADKKKSTKV